MIEEVKLNITFPTDVSVNYSEVKNLVVIWGDRVISKNTFRYKFLRNTIRELGIMNDLVTTQLRPGHVSDDLLNLATVLARHSRVQNVFLMGKRVYQVVINGGPETLTEIVKCRTSVNGRALDLFLCPSYIHQIKRRTG